MPKLRNLNVFMNGTAIGTATNISFDLASQPDYSVECLYLKHGGRISFIKTRQMGKTEINADFFADFPFNPKHCPKVAQRRIRKACYQSFALYKKSYKPKRIPRIRIIKDEGYVLWGAKQEVPRSSFFHSDYGVNLPADLLWKH